MRLSLFASVVAAYAALQWTSTAHGAATTNGTFALNGWFPCGKSEMDATDANATFSSLSDLPFECAQVRAPLCHEGECVSDRTIDLFVKRLRPSTTVKATKALWLIMGGPGSSSYYFENLMLVLREKFQGAVNVYTLDHRGTGRSFYLNCRASQGLSNGSPGGSSLEFFEIPNCIKDVLFQIDNKTAAFSTTSAAKDIEYVVKNLNNEGEVYVYGGSYGTFLTARLMHLAPTTIKGYILDGVVSERNGTFARFATDRGQAGKHFAALCEKDPVCVSKYAYGIKEHGDLHTAWLSTFNNLDKAKPGSNACADLIRGNSTTQSASTLLRIALSVSESLPFGQDVASPESRGRIPAIFKLLNRCTAEDVKTLRAVFKLQSNETLAKSIDQLTTPTTAPPSFNEVPDDSILLMTLIKASEMWTYPSSSFEDETESAAKGVFSVDIMGEYALYCVFNGDWSDRSCSALTALGKQKTPPQDYSKIPLVPFKYERNQYYGKVTKVPRNASLMVMQGHLDFQTAFDLAKEQYDNIEGNNKVFVEFPYGGHCPGVQGGDCGAAVIASFVKTGGSVTAVDTSCIRALPGINFDVDAEIAQRVAAFETIAQASTSAHL